LDEEEEKEEQEDKFEIAISIKDPEKIGEAQLFIFYFVFLSGFILYLSAIRFVIGLCTTTNIKQATVALRCSTFLN